MQWEKLSLHLFTNKRFVVDRFLRQDQKNTTSSFTASTDNNDFNTLKQLILLLLFI